MLFLVGLGLAGVKDITVKGLEVVKACESVYLEAYTSMFIDEGVEELESYYGRKVTVADREFVEQQADIILEEALTKDVAFLVIGDPFGATTHTDIVLRARQKGVKVQVLHNASIMTAVGSCGLQLYSFGETVSIPYWTDTWEPDSFFDKILENKTRGLHTLCLLDIKVKEPNLEALCKGKVVYDPPRFMSVSQASEQMLKIIERRGNDAGITADDQVVGLARVGSSSQQIAFTSLKVMASLDLGKPLHSLVIPGKMHPLETEFLEGYIC